MDKEVIEIIDFLLGSGELDGVSFGERPAAEPQFWWRKKLRAARDYLTDPGYRRVPVEPTEAMLEAAFAAIDEMEMNTVTKADAAYAAMLSASQGEG